MERSMDEASRNSLLLKAEFAALSATTALLVAEQLRSFNDAFRGFLGPLF